MNDAELIDEFFRVERDDESTRVLVKTISWHGHKPVGSWVLGKTLPADTDDETVDETVQRLLRYKWFFRVCEECGERNPIGWRHGDLICQSCAERILGVVY
jgi:hypothetical protein